VKLGVAEVGGQGASALLEGGDSGVDGGQFAVQEVAEVLAPVELGDVARGAGEDLADHLG
jgi:hypothetical protein